MIDLSKIITKTHTLLLCILSFARGYFGFYLSHIIHEKIWKYHCKI